MTLLILTLPDDDHRFVADRRGVYFSVEDADASTAKAQELGGAVVAEPFDVTVGRTAWLLDPLGTPFQLIKLAVVPD